VVAELEFDGEALFDRAPAQFFELCDLCLSERLVPQVSERGATPQFERLG
jgi:hypothetical protein